MLTADGSTHDNVNLKRPRSETSDESPPYLIRPPTTSGYNQQNFQIDCLQNILRYQRQLEANNSQQEREKMTFLHEFPIDQSIINNQQRRQTISSGSLNQRITQRSGISTSSTSSLQVPVPVPINIPVNYISSPLVQLIPTNAAAAAAAAQLFAAQQSIPEIIVPISSTTSPTASIKSNPVETILYSPPSFQKPSDSIYTDFINRVRLTYLEMTKKSIKIEE